MRTLTAEGRAPAPRRGLRCGLISLSDKKAEGHKQTDAAPAKEECAYCLHRSPHHDPESDPPLSHDPESDPPLSHDPESDPPLSHDPESDPPLSHEPESHELPLSEDPPLSHELEPPLLYPPPPELVDRIGNPPSRQQPNTLKINPIASQMRKLIKPFMIASLA